MKRVDQGGADIVCLSHLRWNSVYQRPHHLMSCFGRTRRVFFLEEPVHDSDSPYVETERTRDGVTVLVPHVSDGPGDEPADLLHRDLMSQALRQHGAEEAVLWYHTPMALRWTPDVDPVCVVYDCMDELSAFKDSPRELRALEVQLLRRADLVFTGGQSLFEAKRDRHPAVYAFPSSVDVKHFARSRSGIEDPPDQAGIPRPRLGFYGVLDERLDLDLLDGIAAARPHWQLVMIGPVTKIEESDLPRRPNVFYLGAKSYDELPDYLAGWDVALLPFAHNESTRFISPTKTPEYLAAGKPVVSTSIRDVVRPYGRRGMVKIADTPHDFVAAVERALSGGSGATREEIDGYLRSMSWDMTWSQMNDLIAQVEGEGSMSVHNGEVVAAHV